MRHLHLDIETYSPMNIKSCGAYRYFENFEILLIAYAWEGEPVQIVDLTESKSIPTSIRKAIENPKVIKYAHNAAFERCAFTNYGLNTPVEQWRCSAIKAAYCGLPLSLDQVSEALQLGDKAKLTTGKALISYFTKPCKPTKANGGRTRNLPEDALDKWQAFKEYARQDVEAEREIMRRLESYEIPIFEQKIYNLDQKINDYGVLVDSALAKSAVELDKTFSDEILSEIKKITGIENPNSPAQLKQWLGEQTGKEVKSLAKNEIPKLIAKAKGREVSRVLELRQLSAKSSIKKYTRMLQTICKDSRARGLFQFYGASRTGRWAGRLIQLQNLPQNHIESLDSARHFARKGDLLALEILYGNISDVLSQLIRTSFIAPKGKTFAVCDFSAIEARVIAWLAGEQWRLEVFKGDGKIYEASAAMMFNVDKKSISKGSQLRQKGKIAELALGYQGGVGALKTMGGESMGLVESEMSEIVKVWRNANPNIVTFWRELESAAKNAIMNKNESFSVGAIAFICDQNNLRAVLPSGRSLFYRNPQLMTKHIKPPGMEPFKTESIVYEGIDQTKRSWSKLDTYGGKLAENIVQAVARDLLADAMLRADAQSYNITMHVHDEMVCEVNQKEAKEFLDQLEKLMSISPKWADGLPLSADGYLTTYYKKD